jgi:hypothetical protein
MPDHPEIPDCAPRTAHKGAKPGEPRAALSTPKYKNKRNYPASKQLLSKPKESSKDNTQVSTHTQRNEFRNGGRQCLLKFRSRMRLFCFALRRHGGGGGLGAWLGGAAPPPTSKALAIASMVYGVV